MTVELYNVGSVEGIFMLRARTKSGSSTSEVKAFNTEWVVH